MLEMSKDVYVKANQNSNQKGDMGDKKRKIRKENESLQAK